MLGRWSSVDRTGFNESSAVSFVVSSLRIAVEFVFKVHRVIYDHVKFGGR